MTSVLILSAQMWLSSVKPCCCDISIRTGSRILLAVQMFDGLGDNFMSVFLFFFFFVSQILAHAATYSNVPFLRGEHIRPHPKWPATTCSSDFWEKLISCPRLWVGSLLLRTSRVTGVNSPTRGRFTATDRNHLSAVCCLSPNRPDRAPLGQSHHSKKCLIELNMNRQVISWCMVVSCQWWSFHYPEILEDISCGNHFGSAFPVCGAKIQKLNFKTSIFFFKGLHLKPFINIIL